MGATVERTRNSCLPPDGHNNELESSCDQQRGSLCAAYVSDRHDRKRFCLGINVKFLWDMASFMEAWITLPSLIAPGCRTSDENSLRLLNAHKQSMVLSSSPVPKWHNMGKGYTTMESFVEHLPSLVTQNVLHWDKKKRNSKSYFLVRPVWVPIEPVWQRVSTSGWKRVSLLEPHYQKRIRSRKPVANGHCVRLIFIKEQVAHAKTVQLQRQNDLQPMTCGNGHVHCMVAGSV